MASDLDQYLLAQQLQNAGPNSLPLVRRSAYLADALRQIGQSSQGFKTPASTGMNLLAEAILQYARNRNDKKLKGAEDLDTAKQLDAFRQSQGLPDPLASQPDFPGYQPPAAGSPVQTPSLPPLPAATATPTAPVAPLQTPPAPVPAQSGALDAKSKRLLAEALYGEAGNQGQQGEQAVLDVIRNRSRMSGMPVGDVLSQPRQFTSIDPGVSAQHGGRRAQLDALPDSALAKELALIDNPNAQPALGPNAVNFINPELQLKQNGPLPSWAQGQGTRIGGHVFFDGNYAAPRGYQPQQQPSPFQMAAGPGAENAGTPPIPQGAPLPAPMPPVGGPGTPPAPLPAGAGGQGASPIWQGTSTPQQMNFLMQMAQSGNTQQRQAALTAMRTIQMKELGPPDWVAVPGVAGMFADKNDPTKTMRIAGAKRYISVPGASGAMVNENDPTDVIMANVPAAGQTHNLTPQEAQNQGYNRNAVVQQGPLGVQNVVQPGQPQSTGLGVGGGGQPGGGAGAPHVDATGRLMGPGGAPMPGYEGYRFQQDPNGNLVKTVEPTPDRIKSARFTQMMTQANDMLNSLAQHQGIYKPSNILTSMILSGNIQEAALSDPDRQYLNAAKMLTAARLRLESGAAIPQNEISDTIRNFMGLATDDPRTLAQKARERVGMLQGFQNEGGLYYTDLYGVPGPNGQKVNPPVHAYTDPAGVDALNGVRRGPPPGAQTAIDPKNGHRIWLDGETWRPVN